MILELLFALASAAGVADPVSGALKYYEAMVAYQVTLKSSAGDGGAVDTIRYTYQKPGHVRMDFITPHKGAVLIYDPRKQQVRLWPFGLGFLSLKLDPASRLIQSPTGQRVDRSDIGALLHNVQALQEQGETRVTNEVLPSRNTLSVVVTGRGAVTVGNIHQYELWLDEDTQLPIKVISRDGAGRLIEEVLFEDLQVNPPLSPSFFNPLPVALR